MFTIGSHLSSAKGYLAMAREAVRIGANTFQFFTRNPRGGRAKAMDPADVAAFLDFAREHHLGPILAHASYTLNPATVDPKLQQFVRETIADDLDRLEATPGSLYNLHPGTHGGRGAEAGIQTVAETLDLVLGRAKHTTVLLDTMPGSGKALGGTFEALA
ncbi:MAG: TIM barrel protein, partial [Planctomycetes bacterium]|nr:TIM barrel protein [Planctomycetota bacterium]